MNTICYNCGYFGESTFYWLITNEKTDKSIATFELSDDDISDGDITLEIDCCPNCGCDL